MFANILVPVDGSENALRAITYATKIAARFDAPVTLLHVMRRLGSNRVPEDLRELARVEHIEATEAEVLKMVAERIVHVARDTAKAQGANRVQTVIRHGDPAEVIVEYCDDNGVDLVVMGRRGLGDMAALLMGSVSHKVANLAKCACMTVA